MENTLTGGLAHLWDKVKEYLTNWKTTNFGNGTYNNSGSITVNAGLTLKVEQVKNDTITSNTMLGDCIVANDFRILYAVHGNSNYRTGFYSKSGIAIITKPSNSFVPGIFGYNRTDNTLAVGVISLKIPDNEADGAKVAYKYVGLPPDTQLSLPEGSLHLVFWAS